MSDESEEFEDPVDSAGTWVDRVADAYAEAANDAALGRARPAFAEQFLGVIRNTGCLSAGTPNYTDARYFVDRATPGQLGSSALVSASVDTIPGVRQCLTATNLAEIAGATHLLAPGTLVQVFGFYSRSSPPNAVYVFNSPPGDLVVVKLTGMATGAGEYNGRILGGTSNASPASALTMPAGMTVPTSDNALVLNTEEDGLAGYRLQINTFVVGCIVGATTESTPRWIVMVRGGYGATASPTTLGTGTGGVITADYTSWSKASNGTPLNLWVQTRTFWDTTGNVLYAYLRQISIDARGLIISVSSETRIIVDTTQSCP
jgi:hypothetical protein